MTDDRIATLEEAEAPRLCFCGREIDESLAQRCERCAEILRDFAEDDAAGTYPSRG